MKRHVLKYCLSMLFCCLMAQISFSQARGEDKITFNFECKADLESVSFGGTAAEGYITIHHDYKPHTAFVAPHWAKGNTDFAPVGYVAGQKAQAAAVFNFACEKIAENKVFAKGTGSNGIEFEAQSLYFTGTKGNYAMKMATTAFTANMVDYFAKFQIKWQVKIGNNGTWQDAGTSENPMYVPLSQLDGCNLVDGNSVYYSVIHYACKPAKGLSDLDQITSAIFTAFQTKNVPRIDKPSIGAMMYWGIKNTNPSANPIQCRGLSGLLDDEDCRCGEWASFYQYCLALHKIKGCRGSIFAKPLANNSTGQALLNQFSNAYKNTFNVLPPPYPTVTASNFLVKNWATLTNNTLYVSSGSWPYQNIPAPYIAPNGSIIPIGDLFGAKAQGMDNPESAFGDHVVVCINDKIYDPSYGTGVFNGVNDWETNSLAAHAVYSEYTNSNIETVYLVWVYEQELPNVNQTQYSCK